MNTRLDEWTKLDVLYKKVSLRIVHEIIFSTLPLSAWQSEKMMITNVFVTLGKNMFGDISLWRKENLPESVYSFFLFLNWPKLDIFVAQTEPVWVDDLETRK